MFFSPQASIERTRKLHRGSMVLLDSLSDEALLAHKPKVSGWSIAQQLGHNYQVGNQILSESLKLMAGEGRIAQGRCHPVGLLFFTLNWIPRGAGKSPLKLPPEVTRDDLHSAMRTFERLLGEWTPDRASAAKACPHRMKHPYFGAMTVVQWMRMLEVHTYHHLKICKDLLPPDSRWTLP